MSLEDLSKVEVVVAASKSEQKVTEAPASIDIITSEEIRKQGYRNLDDLLRSVRDFYVTDDRQYSFIGVRGFGSLGGYDDRVLMLVDGHRINDGVYDSFLLGQAEMVEMDMIDRVEIIRGPGSALYGNSAFLGTINIITKKARAIEGLLLTASGGTLSTVKGGARFGTVTEGELQFVASGSLFDSAGNPSLYYPEYDDPTTNNGVAQNADGEQARHAYLSLGLGDWSLRGAYSYRHKAFPTGAYQTTFNDPGNYTSDGRWYGELVYQPARNGSEDLAVRAFFDHSDYWAEYIFGSGATRELNVDYSSGAWAGAEFHWTFQPFEDHKLTVGSEFRDYFEETQGNYTGPLVYLNDRRQYWLLGLFAQDEVRIFPKASLTLGGRFDDYSTFGGHLVPRGALVLGPFDNTLLKLMAGAAFRAPNAYELYYNDGNVNQKGNGALTPENIQTYEAEIERSFLRDHRCTLSVFRYAAGNLIVQVVDPSDGLLVYQNIGGISATGLGFEYQFQSPEGFQGRASYSWQRAQDDATGQWLTNSPQHLAKANAQVPFLTEGLFLSGECQYNSESFGENGGSAPGFAVVNLKLHARDLLAEGLQATLAAYNLFDTRYAYPAAAYLTQMAIPQNGFVLWGSLGYKL